jgi:hypothetical protein
MTISARARVLLIIALGVIVYIVFSPADSESPVEAANSKGSSRIHAASAKSTYTSLAPPSAAALANRVVGSDSAAALFAAHSWYTPPPPPPPAPVPTLTEQQAAALRTPTAPPMPFAYMGTYTPDGAAPVFFLTQGDRVYNVRIGDLLDNKYSVDAFANGQLVMTYKPLNIQQQLSVGVTP